MNFVYAQMKSRNAARRGTSLVEILVVLVILVFGILSVIRLFPAGFLVFRAAQNNGVGQRIGQSLLESVTQDASAIADGVYIYNDAIGFDPNIAPDDLTAWKTNPSDAAYTDINKARYVQNETITVPPARAVTVTGNFYTWSSVYVLNYGPIVFNADRNISAISAPWAGQVGSSVDSGNVDGAGNAIPVDIPNDLIATGQAQYLVDYDAHKIAIPYAAYAQGFVFTVTVNDGSPSAPKTVSIPLTLAASTTSSWAYVDLTPQGVSNSAVWATGSAVLYRPYHEIDTGWQAANHTLAAFSTDPYEFQVRQPSLGPFGANFGVLDFNPLAGGVNGAQPLKARISYIVYNWHVLHEDHSLPYSSQDRTIRLGVDNLKKTGDIQHDQLLYQGLFGSTAPGDVAVCNLDTGDADVYGAGTSTDLDSDAPTAGVDAVGISYKSGRVTFPLDSNPVYNEANPTPNSNGVHVRVYYMGSADWGVALQKAPASYRAAGSLGELILTRNAAQGPPNVYSVVLDPYGVVTAIAFPYCDYGKTVDISGVITYTDTAGKPQTAVLSSLTSAINNPVTLGTKTVGEIVITGGPTLTNCDPTKPITISSVRGVSADALVVWRENDQWKSRLVDTLLPRGN